jgi:hypothetical protein
MKISILPHGELRANLWAARELRLTVLAWLAATDLGCATHLTADRAVLAFENASPDVIGPSQPQLEQP